jgi:hypothetical protein
MGTTRRPLIYQLWDKIEVRSSSTCWPWVGGKTHEGYGKLSNGGSAFVAHRLLYELAIGPIPKGMVVDHTCHNGSGCSGGAACTHRSCCNPAHLEAVTIANNVLRGQGTAAVNARKIHCKRGHPFDETNTVVTLRGYRYCRKCNNEWQLQRRQAAGAGQSNASKTHCINGHPFDAENTRIKKSGKRDCKACDRQRAKERYWTMAAARRSDPK